MTKRVSRLEHAIQSVHSKLSINLSFQFSLYKKGLTVAVRAV